LKTKFSKKADKMAKATTDNYASGLVALQSDPFYMVEDEWLQSAANDVKEIKEQDKQQFSSEQNDTKKQNKSNTYWNNYCEENSDIIIDSLDTFIENLQQHLLDKDASSEEYIIARNALVYFIVHYINNNFHMLRNNKNKSYK